MILCNLSDCDKYRNISPLLACALDYLKNYNADTFTPGSVEIGNGVTVKSEEVGLLPREHARLEAHRQYIDIHVPIKAVETIGWANCADLRLVQEAYNADKDIIFYGDMAQCLLHVRPGQIAIFFPEDAHAPNIGLGKHRKLCIKIPVQ
ncbi:MAG: YhcH/YjgK/YiaL family protein [Muribaculaceae bacterium]